MTDVADFALLARRALHESGHSLRSAARATHYDPAYLSRVLSGRQRASPRLARALDRLLGTGGALSEAARPGQGPPFGSAGEREIAHLRASTVHLVAHDARYGSEFVVEAAVQAWQEGSRWLRAGAPLTDRDRAAYLTALAEAAELAGWLLFDDGRPAPARRAWLAAAALGRRANDQVTEVIALSVLAAHDVGIGEVGRALGPIDAMLARSGLPAHLVSFIHAIRGWAIGQRGERHRSLDDLAAARRVRAAAGWSQVGRLPNRPWGVAEPEHLLLEGETLRCLGRPEAGAEAIRRALDHVAPRGPDERRRTLCCLTSLLAAQVDAGAWHECEATLAAMDPLVVTVRSEQNRRRVHHLCHRLAHDRRAPAWLRSLARDHLAGQRLAGHRQHGGRRSGQRRPPVLTPARSPAATAGWPR